MRTLILLIAISSAVGQDLTSRNIEASCDQVWAAATSVFLSSNLTPQASDRAGGLMKLRWTAGDETYRFAKESVARLTTFRARWTNPVERFRIGEVIFTLAAQGSVCATSLRFSYLGHTPVYGWIDLSTNGVFENALLSLIESKAKQGGTGENNPSPRVRQETPTPGSTVPQGETPKSIVARFTSIPSNAEVQIDGEYWGSTPTVDLTRLSAGAHTIVVKKLGYEPWERKITLAPGDDRTISAELQAQPDDPAKPRIVGNQ